LADKTGSAPIIPPEAIEYAREWQSSIITASSLLITVPLLALSVLAAFSGFGRTSLALVAVPIVASDVSFAHADYFMINAFGKANVIVGIVSFLARYSSEIDQAVGAMTEAQKKDIARLIDVAFVLI